MPLETPRLFLARHGDTDIILNGYWEPLEFDMPRLGDGPSWRRWIDTALDSPDDIVPWQAAPAVPRDSYRVGPRSAVMLYADARSGEGPRT